MADPVTLMLIAGATQAVGAIASGNAQAAQYEAQAQAANWNANMQREQASATAQQTSAREDLQRKQARQVFGAQLAAGAESGVTLTGSASDLFRSSLYDAEMDALNIRYEGELNRVGLLNQAQLSDWEGKVAKSNAKSAKQAGYLNAVSSMASAAAGAYGGGAAPGAAAGSAGGAGLKAGGGLGLKPGGGLGLR